MINSFDGQYHFLSNFFPAPIEYEGVVWPTSEHLYQAAKTLNVDEITDILSNPKPGVAKRKGQCVTKRDTWETDKFLLMVRIVGLKFAQNENLSKLLIETGDEWLVEGNTWHDNLWGDCYCEKCKSKIGKNLLGTILMNTRLLAKGGLIETEFDIWY